MVGANGSPDQDTYLRFPCRASRLGLRNGGMHNNI